MTQVKSKQRVADHGEVFTSQREVNAMLDLVKQETERIESRFLEPACGNGNFLSEILKRKLDVVKGRYGKSQYDFERYAVIAASSINGSLIKRRDFTFHSMLQNESLNELELFSFISDQGEEVYIPSPEKEYPPIHFLELFNMDANVDATSCRVKENTRQDDVSTIVSPGEQDEFL